MDKPGIIYFFDTLCGWCYGFSPVIMKLKKEYGDHFDWEIISGGLAIGDRVAPIGEKFAYIKNALKTVEDHTGVEFGEPFKQCVADGHYIYDSLPPAKALAIVKKLKQEKSFEFAHRMHEAIFVEGQDLNDNNTYYDLATEFELDELEFVREMKTVDAENMAREEFKKAFQFGINGFPAAILKKGDEYFLLNRGYQPYEKVQVVVEKILKGE